MSDYLPLATQLGILFEHVKKSDGSPYTMQEVSQSIGVSLPTLSQLRNGKITNPQLNTLRAICRFFHVPLHYFDTRTPEECYALIAQGRGNGDIEGINYIAHVASSLSPEGQRDLLTVMKWALAAEQQLQAGKTSAVMPHLEIYDDGDAE